MSINLFGVDFSVIFLVAAIVIIVLLGIVLAYQIRLIRNISFLKTYAKETKESKEEQKETQNPILAAVIIAAINQYKNQNLQR
ncbi:MAG: hypothetical protein LBD84_02110 [Campylobacteraceae bacterium]|nr:hypothetical protein [Campylobacteraceae bacterium]